ncbi:MAG: hypothetical protein K2W95_31630 [Candidatus Obscuribacterales bacterium]|nr:hypothetical protein [Candidatus Obscuribacterales bacterium]
MEKILDFLKDFDIRLLAPMATICAIIVSIWLWRLNQKNKSLTYEVLWRNPLVNVRGAARRKLDVRYEGKSVHDADLVLIKIWNNGHLPINASEFLSGVFINMNPTAEIISATITETVPGDLEDRLKGKPLLQGITDQHKLELSALLLNPQDSITIQLVVRRAVGRIAVEGHIQGISAIEPYKYGSIVPRLLTQIGALVMAAGMLLVEPTDIRTFGLEHLLPCLLVFATGYVLLHAGLYWPGKQKDHNNKEESTSAA